jgi:hypothetical protein
MKSSLSKSGHIILYALLNIDIQRAYACNDLWKNKI